MNIFVLKSLSALLNLLVISLVVRLLPTDLAAGYLLMIGYVQLSTLGLGFGIDTSIERYALKVLGSIGKLTLVITVIALSSLRTVAFFAIVELANYLSPGVLSVDKAIFVFAFFTFLFTTQTSLLNGVLRYVPSAAANLVRSVGRFGIFLVPIGAMTLNTLLLIEAAAAAVALLYCIAVFARTNAELSVGRLDLAAVGKFMSWNYLTRFLLSLISLNMVKILVLRSNHPHAVLIAYAIQLTEAVERFLPSVVLAGRYRPELAKTYDADEFGELFKRLRQLGKGSLATSVGLAALHMIALPIAFVVLQAEEPTPFWPIFVICALWLIVSNWKFSLNIVSNVIEENHIQFFVSLILATIFYSVFALSQTLIPLETLALMLVTMTLYPFIWFVLAKGRLSQLQLARSDRHDGNPH